MTKRVILLFACFAISAEALSWGIDCHCPDHFRESEWNSVWCVINRTAVKQAKCISEQNGIYMNLKGLNEFSIPCDNSSSTDPASYCKCKDIATDVLNCTVSILGNKTRDEGKELTCKACVSPGPSLIQKSTDSCKNITYELSLTEGLKPDISTNFPGSDSSGTSLSWGMLLAFCPLLVFIGIH